MNKIRPENSMYPEQYIQRTRSGKAEAAGKPAAFASYGGNQTNRLYTDCMTQTSSPESVSPKEVSDSFRKLLEQISRDYPGVHIVVEKPGTEGERDILSKVLGETGDGYALILSDEFMAGLYAGKESYEKKSQALLECVRRLQKMGAGSGVWLEEDQAVFWQKVPEKNRGAAGFIPSSEQHQDSIYSSLPSPAEQKLQKFKISSGSAYQTAAVYSRLARAGSRSMVQNVMQEARRNIASLKLTAVYGDEKEQKKAKAALRSLEKLLLRGNKKLKRFTEESLTQTRIKRAREREQQEKEMQAKLELNRRKTSRAIGDGAIRKEGQLDALTIPGYRPARHSRYDLERYAHIDASLSAPQPVFTGAGTAAVSSGGTALSPAEGYVVSGVMSF